MLTNFAKPPDPQNRWSPVMSASLRAHRKSHRAHGHVVGCRDQNVASPGRRRNNEGRWAPPLLCRVTGSSGLGLG